MPERRAGVHLYWLPLGAGGRFVRLNGKAYEALTALRERRPRLALYHAALVVDTGDSRYAIESTPVPRGDRAERGAVVGGPVGLRGAGRLRVFRYEVRCWRDGTIADLREAVDSPRLLTGADEVARRVVALVPDLPVPVWGRDELRAGEMWNSNSVVAWLLERAGLDAASCLPPAGGRAPGWDAGVVVARRGGGSEPLE